MPRAWRRRRNCSASGDDVMPSDAPASSSRTRARSAPKSSASTASATTARRSSRPNTGRRRRWCRLMTIPTSSPGRARSAWNRWRRRGSGITPDRPRAERWRRPTSGTALAVQCARPARRSGARSRRTSTTRAARSPPESPQERARARSICDAILTAEPGELTFAINRELLAGGLTVSDDEAVEAVRDAATSSWSSSRAAPSRSPPCRPVRSARRPDTIAVVLSGGNIDLASPMRGF